MDNKPDGVKRFAVSVDELPENYPTNFHSTQFWEQLGRTIATFCFLEEILRKAIFAFTATRRYGIHEWSDEVYEEWLNAMQWTLSAQLSNLAEKYGKAVRDNADSTIPNVDELVSAIKDAKNLRNVLCHGSWRPPDTAEKSLPLYFDREGVRFETLIDIDYLCRVQDHVVRLSCVVINSVTDMGWQFPGSSGPGKVIWEAKDEK